MLQGNLALQEREARQANATSKSHSSRKQPHSQEVRMFHRGERGSAARKG
jgi:hypothetical protein